MRRGDGLSLILVVALGIAAATSFPLHAASGEATRPVDPARRASGAARLVPACAGAVQHPIEVRVRPLDAIRSGASVRLEVSATSRTAVTDAEVRLVSTGGAVVDGARRLPLGRLAPERGVAGTFRVTVPDDGRRFLVQFVVTGEGPAGPLARGAVYNLLPGGPVDPGREVTATGGARVHEFAATRSGR